MKNVIVLLFSCLLLISKSTICLSQFPEKTNVDELIYGAIDFHIHSSPDVFDRSLSDIEVAQLAEKRGFRAIVLKNHVSSTAARAVLVNAQMTKIKAYGGIVLNKAIGGINPEAVIWMHKMSPEYGKIVWFPTFDAAYQKEITKDTSKGITILKDGKLIDDARTILQIIAKENMVLATGHLSPKEIFILVNEAKKLGVKNILITHPLNDEPGLTVDQMNELAQMGAILELTYLGYLSGPNAPLGFLQKANHISMDKMVQVIKKIGAKNFLLSSDLGQVGNATPPDGIKMFVSLLMEKGISKDEINLMIRTNPGVLLGLKQ